MNKKDTEVLTPDKNKIELSIAHKKIIAKEFGKSLQSVRMSLEYVFNSTTAKMMRSRAKELLESEANKINE